MNSLIYIQSSNLQSKESRLYQLVILFFFEGTLADENGPFFKTSKNNIFDPHRTPSAIGSPFNSLFSFEKTCVNRMLESNRKQALDTTVLRNTNEACQSNLEIQSEN